MIEPINDAAEVQRLQVAIDDALYSLRYAVDPFKAPEQVTGFVRAALVRLEGVAE